MLKRCMMDNHQEDNKVKHAAHRGMNSPGEHGTSTSQKASKSNDMHSMPVNKPHTNQATKSSLQTADNGQKNQNQNQNQHEHSGDDHNSDSLSPEAQHNPVHVDSDSGQHGRQNKEFMYESESHTVTGRGNDDELVYVLEYVYNELVYVPDIFV